MSRKAWTVIEPLSPSLRRRTDTTPSATSFWTPTESQPQRLGNAHASVVAALALGGCHRRSGGTAPSAIRTGGSCSRVSHSTRRLPRGRRRSRVRVPRT